MAKDKKDKSKSKKHKHGKDKKKKQHRTPKHHKIKNGKMRPLKPPKIIIEKPNQQILPPDKSSHYSPLPFELKRKMREGKQGDLVALSKDQMQLLAHTGKVKASRRPGRPRMYPPGQAPSIQKKNAEHAAQKKEYKSRMDEEDERRNKYTGQLRSGNVAMQGELIRLITKMRQDFETGGLTAEQKLASLKDLEDKVARASVEELAGDAETIQQNIKLLWSYVIPHIRKTATRFRDLGVGSEAPPPPPPPDDQPPRPPRRSSSRHPRRSDLHSASFSVTPAPPLSLPIHPTTAPAISSASAPSIFAPADRHDEESGSDTEIEPRLSAPHPSEAPPSERMRASEHLVHDMEDEEAADPDLAADANIQLLRQLSRARTETGRALSTIQDRARSMPSTSHIRVSASEPISRSARPFAHSSAYHSSDDNAFEEIEYSGEERHHEPLRHFSSDLSEPHPPASKKGKQKAKERSVIHSVELPDEEIDHDNFVKTFTTQYLPQTPEFLSHSYSVLKRANQLGLFDKTLGDRYNSIQQWHQRGKKGDIATARSQVDPSQYIQTTLNQLIKKMKKSNQPVDQLLHPSSRTQYRRKKKQ